jgi:hypothetical protein
MRLWQGAWSGWETWLCDGLETAPRNIKPVGHGVCLAQRHGKHKRQSAAGGKRKFGNADTCRCTLMHADRIARARTPLLAGRGLACWPGWPTDRSSARISVHLLASALIPSCFAAYRTSLCGEVRSCIQAAEAAGAPHMATECEQTQPRLSLWTWVPRRGSAPSRPTAGARRHRRDSWRPAPTPSGEVLQGGAPRRARIATRRG